MALRATASSAHIDVESESGSLSSVVVPAGIGMSAVIVTLIGVPGQLSVVSGAQAAGGANRICEPHAHHRQRTIDH
jgi:hypothetical protein